MWNLLFYCFTETDNRCHTARSTLERKRILLSRVWSRTKSAATVKHKGAMERLNQWTSSFCHKWEVFLDRFQRSFLRLIFQFWNDCLFFGRQTGNIAILQPPTVMWGFAYRHNNPSAFCEIPRSYRTILTFVCLVQTTVLIRTHQNCLLRGFDTLWMGFVSRMSKAEYPSQRCFLWRFCLAIQAGSRSSPTTVSSGDSPRNTYPIVG